MNAAVAAAQRLRRRPARCRARAGSSGGSRHRRRRRRPRRCDVVVVVSSSSPSSPRKTSAVSPRSASTCGHHRRHPRVGAADRRGRHPGRVGQRAEEVEGGRHAELAPRPRRRAACRRGTPARSRTRCRPRRPSRPRRRPGRSMATPSSSSTSADAAGRGRGPVAVLDDRPPGAGDDQRGHRRDVDGVRPVGAGADDVDGAARSTGSGAARSSIVRTRPASSSGVSPLARSSTANAASCAGRRLAGHDLVHRPGGVVGGQRPSPAISAVEQRRPGRASAGGVGHRSADDGDAGCAGGAAARRRPRRLDRVDRACG